MKQLMAPQDKQLWKDSYFILDLLKALSFSALALIINYYAVRYATAHAGPSVPDLVLDGVAARRDQHVADEGADHLAALVLAGGAYAHDSLARPAL